MLHLPRWVHRVAMRAVAATMLSGGVAHAEDVVLLASTVPGYTPGMTVASGDRLSLPDGASATLLFQSGDVLRLRGPFEGTLDQQHVKTGQSSIAMLADMFRSNGVDATVIGASRSLTQATVSRALEDVQIDPERSGTYCLTPTSTVWVTRPLRGQTTFALHRRGSTRTMAWPADAARSEWPGDVPIDDGSQFEVVMAGAAHATVTFRGLPAATSGAAQLAAGILLGCHAQFDPELRRLTGSIAAPELWINTDHGRRPTYHSGEPIKLTIMANMDGFLYCVAVNTSGGAVPIFPAGAVDGAQLRGAAPLLVPGRRQAAGPTAGPGLAQIRCWMTDRDITAELPHGLVTASSERLPDQLSSDLDGLFGRIGGTRIATDTVTLTAD